MPVGRKSAGVRLVNAHMGFSIWGSVMAGCMAWVSGYHAVLLHMAMGDQYHGYSDELKTAASIFAVSAVVGFIAIILLIVSAAYCCCSTPYNCCSCCCAQSFNDQPLIMQTVCTQQTFPLQGDGIRCFSYRLTSCSI
ncbi:unnamed protein product [Clavelina lepadiformis]|uniref:Uncharacterized protein n=1 Tax=Clavelina lepadiformis TaxID=159417 RepID=A0ABP0GNK4_CLALP